MPSVVSRIGEPPTILPPLCITAMLPKSWLSPRGNDTELPAVQNEKQPAPAASLGDGAKSTARPSLDRALTAALYTPHDAVLAELQGKKISPDPAATRATLDAPAVTRSTSLERAQGASSPGALHASPASSSASPEPIFDPFSGGLAYILSAPSPDDADAGNSFEQSKDELWAQLGRIRQLQSEIAVMHAQMEGIGGGDGRNLKKAPTRSPTDNILGEEWPDAAQDADDKKRERNADFDNLSKAFEGRHNAIDGIMNKLGELSATLAAFHALPTPVMDFASRNNTKESVLSSPSPTFYAGSPASGHAIPSQLHKELQRLEIPKSESPDPSPIS